VFHSIKKIWGDLSTASKSTLVVLLVGLLVLFVYSLIWVTNEDYQVLFSDLNPQDASSMVSELEHLKVSYKLIENGTTILVDKDVVYKTRLKLIGKGLNLNGSVGFELFNNTEFGMTEFAQKVNYLRALQGELERTIVSFEEIKAARVHLVLPESGLFKRKDAKPKASVTITMKNGLALTPEQVVGIQKLVSASVSEITPSEVTIVDQKGLALTKTVLSDNESSNLSERLEVKRQLENYINSKIVSVLDRVVGSGQAIVSVDVDLSYDQVKITKEDVVPLPNTHGQSVGAIVKKRTSSQVDEMVGQQNTFTEENALNQNVPSGSSTNEVEYINNKRIEQILSSPGIVNKLSVGVIIPNINDAVKLAKIKDVISMTAGINRSRGDGLVVHDIEILEMQENSTGTIASDEFQVNLKPPNSTKEEPLGKNETGINYMYLILAILGSLILLLVLRMYKNNNKKLLSKIEKENLLNEINAWAGK